MSNGLLFGKVETVHPEAHAVSLTMLHNGARWPMVQMLGHSASTNTGTVDLPEPTAATAPGDITPTKDRDVYAAVMLGHGGTPFVLGFFHPQVSELLFKDRPNFRVQRHASDVYQTLDDEGRMTMMWPNGTHLVVGEDPVPEDLTGKDFDAKWKAKRNLTRAPNIRCVVKDGAGVQKALLNISPAGRATITLAEDLDVTVAGAVNLAVTGNIISSAAGWTHTGPVTFVSTVTMNADLNVAGTITGTTDVVAGTKHLKAHVHSGVQAGGSNTGGPV